jgi:hypothetical protein
VEHFGAEKLTYFEIIPENRVFAVWPGAICFLHFKWKRQEAGQVRRGCVFYGVFRGRNSGEKNESLAQ